MFSYICNRDDIMHSPMNQFYIVKLYLNKFWKQKTWYWTVFQLKFSIFILKNEEFQDKITVIYHLKPFIMYFSSNNCLDTCLSIYADNVNSKIEIHNWICLYFLILLSERSHFRSKMENFSKNITWIYNFAFLKSFTA